MIALLFPLTVLVQPVTAMGRALSERRWVVPLTLLMAAVAFAGVALAVRWDPSGQVVRELSHGDQGEVKSAPLEKDIEDGAERLQHLAVVGGVAAGLFGAPLAALALAAATWVLVWLWGGKGAFGGLFCAICVALLPYALYKLLLGSCELWQLSLDPARADGLLPAHLGAWLHFAPGGKAFRLASAVDLFRLWCAGLLGLGVREVTRMSWGRSLGVAMGLYLSYAAVVLVALPGMLGGHP
jgi:hypothetical protein